jgi:hypothetical protein
MYRLPPRLTDWSLACAAGVAAASGLVSLISGRPDLWFVFALHGAAGFWLLLLLYGKLRRVWPRLVRPRLWDRRTILGFLATVGVAFALGSGIWWVIGGDAYLAGFGLLNWHIILGFALVGLIALHMLARARRLRVRDIHGRRQALAFGALVVGAAALWPAQQNGSPAHASLAASPATTFLRQAGLPTSHDQSPRIRGISPSLGQSRLLSGSVIRTC